MLQFNKSELKAVHDALITGLQAMGEIQRIWDYQHAFPDVWEMMRDREMAPVHPTGNYEIQGFCEALRYVHEAIFDDGHEVSETTDSRASAA